MDFTVDFIYIPTNYYNIFTPLNNSIRTADEFSSKLPVTDLYVAPRRGANSNLRWYKWY